MKTVTPALNSEINQSTPKIKLDLACGQVPREGFEGVDAFAPDAKYKVNLLQFPWPWADSSVDEIFCSHFIEHIPMTEIDGKDLLFVFFDECYRILKPNAQLSVVCPNARSNRAFQDPTHRRFIVAETFLYFSAEWRQTNKLDHYNVNSNFTISVMPLVLATTAQQFEGQDINKFISYYWNVALDWQATMVAIK